MTNRYGRVAPFLLLAATACVTSGPAPQVDRRVGEHPTAGVSGVARVGEVVYENYDYTVSTSPTLEEGFSRSYLLGRIYIPPGAALLPRPKRDGSLQYCTAEPSYSGGGSDITCFSGPPGGGYFTHVRVPSLKYGSWTTMKQRLPYAIQERILGEGFKMELVYQGVADNVLRMAYREYKENLARPAFHQDLTYTLEEEGPTEVSFRSLRIEVTEADNSGLKYRVLQGLY